MTRRFSVALLTPLLAMSVGFPALAQAQERKSPLADAPAIRRRLELRDKRFELGAGVGSTIGQDFYHAVIGSVRASFHLNDWLAIGGIAGFNLTPNLNTDLHDRLLTSLATTTKDRAPSAAIAERSMNKIGQIYALQAEIIPFTGKYSLFDKFFMNYDFFMFGGPGFINFTADDASCANPSSCAVTGMTPGFNFGVGMHSYINEYVGVNAEVRNLLVHNNPAGRDITGDMVADSFDKTWDANYIFSLNVVFLLPSKAEKSH